MKKNITISIDRYKDLLAAEFELEAIRQSKIDILNNVKKYCQNYIKDYCKNEPNILNWFRENDLETNEEIIEDLWFEDLADFEVDYYCNQEEVINYYDSRSND